MKISRRNFLGKSFIALAAAVVSPLAISKALAKDKIATQSPDVKLPDVKIKRHIGGNGCADFTEQVKVIDYVPGQPIPYLSPARPACHRCLHKNHCTQYGQHYEHRCPDFKPNIEIREYSPGETVTIQDLMGGQCAGCKVRGKCTETGKGFKSSMKTWSRKLQAEWHKKAFGLGQKKFLS